MKPHSPYDAEYAAEDFYWGKTPSAMCDRVIEIIQAAPAFRPRVLDLGCGEGRNAVHFAKRGYEVVGLDLSAPGLEKIKRYAAEEGVRVETLQASIVSYELEDTYDVVFSTGTLQYLPPSVRSQRFQDYKEHTAPDGLNALSVFVDKPFIPAAPDTESTAYTYRSGELMGHYWDWEILFSTEEIFDCTSSGIPHKHAVNRIIARRPGDG